MSEQQISNILKKGLTILEHEAFKSKDQAFIELTQIFYQEGVITDKDEFLRALYERESIGSTYMGEYIALPHGKSTAVIKPSIGFIRCIEPFTYLSHDEKGSVKYIFMLAIPESQPCDQYIKILAQLSGMLVYDEFKSELGKVKNYDELINTISRFSN